MKVISKEKEKGNTYGTMKKMKKKNRLLEEKDIARRTENKRINAENRKERELKNELFLKSQEVKILDLKKGMLIIEIEGAQEKRSLDYDKKVINNKNFLENLDKFQIKIYGEMIKISKLKNYEEIKEDLKWKIEEIF